MSKDQAKEKEDRVYAFAVGQDVAVKESPIQGKIIERAPDKDQQVAVEVSSRNAHLYPGIEPGKSGHKMVPVNAYRIEYVGDHGRMATDWWHEDMLAAV